MNNSIINSFTLLSLCVLSINSYAEKSVNDFSSSNYIIKNLDINKDGKIDKVIIGKGDFSRDFYIYVRDGNQYNLLVNGKDFTVDGGPELSDITPLHEGDDVLKISTYQTNYEVDYILSYEHSHLMLDKTVEIITYPMDLDHRQDTCIVKQYARFSDYLNGKYAVNLAPEEESQRAQKCILHFDIKSNLDQIISRIKSNQNTLSDFDTKQRYAALLEKYPLTLSTVRQYNDIAFFLAQHGSDEESIFLLEKIIKQFPEHTVAYINIGDAYWNVNQKNKAKQSYAKYIELMKKTEKESKIPKKIFERVR